MIVIKRDGREVPFDKSKIEKAILGAMKEVGEVDEYELRQIAKDVKGKLLAIHCEKHNVEEIQDIVEETLLKYNHYKTAKAYMEYRLKHKLVRESNTTDKSIKELLSGESDYWNKENSNKNAKVVTVQRDYLAGITSVDISKRFLLDKDIVEAHDKGIIHFHDMDYYAQNALHNCCLINLEDMLQNGTVVNGVMIEKPHRLITATTIATQIITAVASSQYGGCTITLTHLAPFVKDSWNIYYNKYKNWGFDHENCCKFADADLKKEISDSVQTFNYQINSMSTTNGQAPFLSVCMYMNETQEYKKELAMLIEEFLKQRIVGMKNEVGAYVTQAFPKLLYVLEEDNIETEAPYFYLTELAAKCTAKRMVPDYISEKKMKEYKIDKNGEGHCYPCMGCRSFLTPYIDENGKPKYYGRFNCGVVTVNLPDIALSAVKQAKENNDNNVLKYFWDIFEERTELCHRALQARIERLSNVKSDVAPILWQHGALARLNKGESIAPLIRNGYATVSLGYAGLYECVKAITGESHSHGKGKEFGLEVMKALNRKTKQWEKEENIAYSLYGSPIESGTYKFAKALKARFGVIEGITDKDYITNSYHVNVREKIDPFKKLAIEAEYQKLSPGGAISYTECANLTQNIEVVLEVLRFIYDNIMYAELNTKSDFCQVCGSTGEIKIIDEDGKLIWECPVCGNRDQSKMNVSRRTCGYIGSNFWNEGRTQEIKERYVHIDTHEVDE